ncbi:uncharacterized protein BYT42DRAFT_204279 [Radiomyces spectabilis]|uniref:uncharacterized protein n=1 Tax=Radiomyces spectabilis TaxID=64574 RepID=UPI002220CF49|nr:uncharacterized protein BYT42DRAFT_204279 [Radiomyces spectabilis]KAI8391683.1 hypothetical protein BYT42DRAFT_204279 [Radiomyces spectabilis]
MEIRNGSTLRRGGGGSRKSGRIINPSAVYDFALRCAIRAYLGQSGSTLSPPKEKKSVDHRRSVHLGMSEMLGNFTDKFSDDSKPDKLTREIVRALLRRLDDIRKGKDTLKPEYRDPCFIAIIAQTRKYVQQHRYRPTGTVNNLIVEFLQISQMELKRSNLTSAAKNEDLKRYIARFAEILMCTLQEDAPSSAVPEVMDKLLELTGSKKTTRHNSEKRSPASPSVTSTKEPLEALEQFGLVKMVQKLFGVDDAEHRRKLCELQSICTESALLIDLKKCINNVHMNQPFPGRREDFTNPHVYETWQRREIQQLNELSKSLLAMHPELSLGGSAGTDIGSYNLLSGHGRLNSEGKRSSMYNSGSEYDVPSPTRTEASQSSFTFIPNDPRSYFRVLMDKCIDYDMKEIPDSERAKSSVLSQQSDDLLRECWIAWRLTAPFRAVLYLELVKSRFDANELRFEDVKDATRNLDKVIKENDMANWTINDRESLIRVFEGLNQTFLHALADALSEYWKISPQWVADIVTMLDRIYDNPAYLEDHDSPLREFASLEEVVKGAAVTRWTLLEESVKNSENDDMTKLLTLADKLLKDLVSLSKRKFKTPIKGIIDVPSIVMTRQMFFFTLQIENWAYLPEAKEADIEVTFELYHKVLGIKRLCDQHGLKKDIELFKVELWFLQHVRRWMITTSAATPEWVENAIKQDEFARINDVTLHSSSVVDLFSMFHQAVDFVQNLQWPNELQLCRFMTALSKVISVALEQYTYTLEDMITDHIYPRLEPETEHTSSPASSFLDKARHQLYGSSKKHGHLVLDFTPELCVKINNIEAARARLDRLYQIMDVDDVAEYMRDHDIPTVDKPKQTNFLYSIKIVRAENLQPLDNNGLSDPYVVLEIDGKQITRTRTVYETLNPRWDQVFDIWLTEKTVDVLAVVYDEDLIGANDECGGVWFKLSPDYFDDYQTHELVLKLHPQGKLILRVSMEGEKDDIQFWFGKAFRTLKRAENDAAGLIVDRMSRMMRQVLSRKTLDKLLGRDRSFFSSFSRTQKHVEPSLQDCEDAIAPLLDYLERNLKILNDNLTETNMQMVILKIWKEILITLEGVLLPPLSEHPSDMKPLDDYEFHVVFKWLELLKVLFNGGEDGDAVTLDKLENSQYYALLAINVAYNLETDQLIRAYHAALKNQVELKMRGGRKADRSKSVYHSRNTVRKRKPVRKSLSIDLPNSETILRILRMRSGKHVREFLHAEFAKRNNPLSTTTPAATIAPTASSSTSASTSPPPPPPPPHAANPQTLQEGFTLPVLPAHVITPSEEEHTLPV